MALKPEIVAAIRAANPRDENALRRVDNIEPWPATLPLDLALGVDPIPTILERYNLSQRDWDVISNMPAFRLELLKIGKEIRESGLSFKRKAAYQAESYLMELDNMMLDETVPPSTKLDIFKTLAKFGELEPKETSKSGDGGIQFALQINIG